MGAKTPFVGIDTLRIGTTVTRVDSKAAGWSGVFGTDEAGHHVRSLMRKLDCGAVLQVMPTKTGRSAFVECSVPKMLHGDNIAAVTTVEAVEAMRTVTEQAEQFVDFDDDAFRVNRLDAVRDFTDIDDAGSILLSLSGTSLKGRKERLLHREPTLGNSQTLTVRTKGRGGRLYDKYEETQDDKATGRLRFEAQVRRRALRASGVEGFQRRSLTVVRDNTDFFGDAERSTVARTISSVTDDDVRRICREHFEWAGFGATIEPMEVAISKVFALRHRPDGTKVTERTRLALIGHLHVQALGVAPSKQGTRESRWRLRRDLALADVHGIGSVDGAGFRLDFDRGLIAA